MIVFLIGFMGCGKTTLGKKLARKLNYSFVDLDELIEKEVGCSISKIFQNEGEEAFREKEKNTLHTLTKKQNLVVSTGGGTPCFFNNLEFMNRSGITIYLKMTEGLLLSRLMQSENKRPLLKNKTEKELKNYISELLAKREPYYTMATKTIEVKNIKIADIIELVK